MVLAFWTPAPLETGICIFRRTVDLPCPGCGLTRAFGHLARGDLGAAFAVHPLAPFLAAELATGWALLGLAAHGSGRGLRGVRPERWAAATGFVLVAFWLGRLAIGDLSVLP